MSHIESKSSQWRESFSILLLNIPAEKAFWGKTHITMVVAQKMTHLFGRAPEEQIHAVVGLQCGNHEGYQRASRNVTVRVRVRIGDH